MNEDVKTQWCDALTSGKYRKAKGVLRYTDETGPHHCVLGVLTDLFCKANGVEADSYLGYPLNLGVLHDDVARWAGLDSADPVIGSYFLSYFNDNNMSFDELAELIKYSL